VKGKKKASKKERDSINNRKKNSMNKARKEMKKGT